MAPWTPAPGHTLFAPSGPSGVHLFVLTHGPVEVKGYGPEPVVGLVSVCSVKDGLPYDTACQLTVGDHPFIKHPSYVSYRHMRADRVSHVQALIDSGFWAPNEPVSAAVLSRIVGGLQQSRQVAREYKVIFA